MSECSALNAHEDVSLLADDLEAALPHHVVEDGGAQPHAKPLLAVAEGELAGFSDLAEANPGWGEPLVLLAQTLRDRGDWAGAEAAYRRVLDVEPLRLEALTALGAHLALNHPAEACALLSRACAQPGATWEAWHALGVACLKDDAAHEAWAALDQACHLVPERLDILLLRGEAACAAGETAAELDRLSESAGSNPVIMVARAAMFEAAGQEDAALGELEAAVAIAPDHAAALAALGSLLGRRDQHKEAEAVLRRAVAAGGVGPQARLDLATLLMRRQHPMEALGVLDGLAAEIGPDTSVACNRAVALCSLGWHDRAETAARDAVHADPGSFQAWRALCNVLPYTPGANAAVLRKAASDAAALLPRSPKLHRRAAPARLRVGILSASLRTHPVGWLTVAGFEHLDRQRFDVVCLGRTGNDPLARRFAARAAGWVDTAGLSDVALARLAREQGVDILIDAGGHGDGGRMAACAHRLAPVQAKWVGMQNATTGLPEMDWFITDRWETPEHLAHNYTERLLTMPDGYVCYAPPPYAPAVAPLPAFRRGHVTFGCFHNLSKVTEAVLSAWCAVLQRAPGARLVLKNHQLDEAATRSRIRSAFAVRGLAEQVELRGASEHRELLRQYADVDIVLDPFPYGGGLTTCEALWMGVPTITLPGDFFASRHSLSHLSNAGLDGWHATDVDAYVELACRRASDLRALAVLRSGLRDQVRASPLCNAPRFGRSLGAALERMWDES